MVGQGTGQWRILQKLLECAPLAIMAEQLAAVGAKGQQCRELTLLIKELAAPSVLSNAVHQEPDGQKKGEKSKIGCKYTGQGKAGEDGREAFPAGAMLA
jgi:hypothetical protein